MDAEPLPQRGISLADLARVAAVGVGAALFAEAFRAASRLVYGLFGRDGTLRWITALSWPVRVASIAVACVLGAWLARLASQRGSASVTKIAEIVAEGSQPLSIRGALLRALGAFAAMTAGGSIGREGPIIQFGASWGLRVGKHAHEIRARELVAAGTAAGFAAAYNAPIAGTLFVIELMPRLPARLTVARLGVATVAGAVTAHAISRDLPLYGAHALGFDRTPQLVAFAVVGLVCGAIGAAFMKSVRATRAQVAARAGSRPWIVSVLFGLVAGCVIASAPITAGNGYDGITSALESRPAIAVAAGWLLLKAVATIATVSSGAPGGVFTPSMFLGAMAGLALQRAFVHLAPGLAPSHTSMAFVGMASMIAATTHAPLTAAVLAIELSGSAGLTLPLLLAVGLSSLVARRLDEDNIYEIEREAH